MAWALRVDRSGEAVTVTVAVPPDAARGLAGEFRRAADGADRAVAGEPLCAVGRRLSAPGFLDDDDNDDGENNG